jgi:glycosyltransferase involved in cell wall biosynthesis
VSLVKTSIAYGAATIVRVVAAIGLNKVLAVYVGPAGYALVGQFANIVALATSASGSSVGTGVTKYTAEYFDDEARQTAIWRAAARCITIGCAVLATVLLVASEFVAQWLLGDGGLSTVVVALALTLLPIGLNNLLLAVMNGRKAVRAFVIQNVATSITAAALSWMLAAQYGLTGALLALSLNQALMFLVTMWLCRREPWMSWQSFVGPTDKASVRAVLMFALMTLTSAAVLPVGQMLVRSQLIDNLGRRSMAGGVQDQRDLSHALHLHLERLLPSAPRGDPKPIRHVGGDSKGLRIRATSVHCRSRRDVRDAPLDRRAPLQPRFRRHGRSVRMAVDWRRHQDRQLGAQLRPRGTRHDTLVHPDGDRVHSVVGGADVVAAGRRGAPGGGHGIRVQLRLVLGIHRLARQTRTRKKPGMTQAPATTRTLQKGIVSLLIPLYRHESTVARALDSVLLSDTHRIQLVVCDDASPDRSYDVAQAWFQRNGNRFHDAQLLRHEKNVGITGNLNFLVARATGEFITLLASDDELTEASIDAQRGWLESHPDCDFVYGNVRFIDEDGAVVLDRVIGGRRALLLHRRLCATVDILYRWGMPWPRLFARTSAFLRFGPYIAEHSFEDRWTALNVAQTRRFGYFDRIVQLYRVRREGAATGRIEPSRLIRDMQDVERRQWAVSTGLQRWLLWVRINSVRSSGRSLPLRAGFALVRQTITTVHSLFTGN